jgi:hypothetical protein
MTPDEALRSTHRPQCALLLGNKVDFSACELSDWLTFDKGVIEQRFPDGLQHAQGVLSKTLLQDELQRRVTDDTWRVSWFSSALV